MSEPRGLVLVNTGSGKGKTTAAVGAALRLIGHGGRVAVIQFIKSAGKSGELLAARQFGGDLEIHALGRGFIRPDKGPVTGDDRRAAREALDFARGKILSGDYDMVILDEVTYLPALGLAAEEEILEILKVRPPRVHVFLTGRNASAGLIGTADMVTEMKEIKHPYQAGVKARRGIEF